MNVIYYGLPAREAHGVIVRYMDKDNPADKGVDLPLRDDLAQHGEKFEWGKIVLQGRESKALLPGSAQLALAICAHALADDERALKLHQRFKMRVVSTWKGGEHWAITAEDVAASCDKIEADELTPQQKAAIEGERPVIERESGMGVEQQIVWDTDELGNRLKPRGAE